MNMLSHEFNVDKLYQILLEKIRVGVVGMPNLALVGIHSGGAWLAAKLAADFGLSHRLGFIDVSFYRDDYAVKGLNTQIKKTEIPFEVEGADIVLIDDVLYTGRTTRAAINELFDYGRPAKIMLAALVDRGGRELPIAADFVAQTVALMSNQSLVLQRDAKGQLNLTIDHA